MHTMKSNLVIFVDKPEAAVCLAIFGTLETIGQRFQNRFVTSPHCLNRFGSSYPSCFRKVSQLQWVLYFCTTDRLLKEDARLVLLVKNTYSSSRTLNSSFTTVLAWQLCSITVVERCAKHGMYGILLPSLS